METRDIYPSLPKEITEEILSRLPVKSLLRFRCISKAWQSLIDSKRFIKTHLQNSARNTSLARHKVVLLKYVSSLPMLFQSSVLDSSDTPDALELESPVDVVKIVGCCNGLVCVLLNSERQRQPFVLWNPSLRISKKLPQTDKMSCFHFYCCEFGWDESSGDYKVFAIATRASGKSIYWIYSLKRDSWKESEEVKGWDSCKKANRPRYEGSEMGVFASGSLHWETTDRRGVVTCDLKREVLGAVELPECWDCCRRQGIEVIGECLSVYYWCEDSSCLDIWMKKKESWEKVVVLDHFFSPLYISPALAPFWSGGFLLIKIGNLLVFDGKRFRNVVSLIDADVYIESLISPLEF